MIGALLTALGMALLIELVLMTVVYLVAWKTGNAGIVDIFWPFSIVLLAFFYIEPSEGNPFRDLLMLAMVVTWGLRLSGYLYQRNLGHEDPRYTELKQKWGEKSSYKMYGFFLIQGLAAVFLSLPFLLVSNNPYGSLHWLEWLGFLVWLGGITGEAVADHQLNEFKKDPASRGKTCRNGLWRYSRHPNYFFEWVLWCGYGLFALASPLGWLALLCPAAMYHFLRNVTGVPLAEKQALRSRGEDYRQYQSETPPFFPWFPRKENKDVV